MPSILNSKKIIRVGIDGGNFIPFSPVKSGIQRIVDSFLKEISHLKNNDFIFNYYYFSKEKTESQFEKINFKRLPQRLFASFFLPFYFQKDKNDFFLGFSGYLPPLITLTNAKKIIFLYDIGFIKYPQFYFNHQKLRKMVLRAIKFADRIVTLSNYAKEQIEKYFFVNERKKIVSLYPGVDHLLGKNSVNQLIKFKYFLYVGVIKPIKKIDRIFKTFYYFLREEKNKDFRLVLIGQKEKEYFNKLRADPYYLQLKEEIIFKENVSDAELVNYYHNAVALLNFSYEEGFCFPVFEALSLGKKVIVNNLVIYREFEDRFDNLLIGENEKEIVQLMIEAAKIHHQRLLDRKLSFKSFFTWENFVQRLLKITREI